MKAYDTDRINHKCHWEREAMNTPTEATRWHTQAAREGHRAERLRKVRMSLEGLKTKDTR